MANLSQEQLEMIHEITRAVSGGLGVQRIDAVSNQISPEGCCNFLDRCGDGDIMSLHMSGQLPLLDWIGFDVSDVCYRVMEFTTYVRPAYANGSPTAGWLADPCATPNGVEYGTTKITVDDFGRFGRKGPTRDIMKPKKYCITDPIWRLDGSKVTDEREWDMKFVTDQVLADINLAVVNGNSATPGQFDGLESWVKTGYPQSILDSIVINWNGNPMAGGAGITWNGAAVAATVNFIQVLRAAVNRTKQRMSWSARLKNQQLQVGDVIAVLPTSMIECLLDFYACWSVCPGEQYSEVVKNKTEVNNFRNTLLGGLFGFGKIFLDGFEIPILGYDWGLINGPTTGDMYVLCRRVGNFRIWEGEHISATVAANENPDQGYFMTDGGRMLWKVDTQMECKQMFGWMHPRMFCKAPWAQIRIQNIKCEVPGGFLSVDPNETSFYPLSSFEPAECPA